MKGRRPVDSEQNQIAFTPECRVIRRQLGADLDEPTADVSAHLARCAACRAEARRMGATWALLNVVEPVDPSPQFAHRVWARIEAEGSRVPGRRWGGLPVWSWRWAAAGIAVVLAAVVPVVVWHQDRAERPELVAQLDVMESRELLTDIEVVQDLDVLLLIDDP